MSAPAGHQGGIVAVGYGGSEAAQLAVRWAAEYAAATGLNLRVVHAWVWPVFTKKLGPVKGVAGSGLRHAAEAMLAEGVELARAAVLDAVGPAPGTAPPVVAPQETPQQTPEEAPREAPPTVIEAGAPDVEPVSDHEPERAGPAVDGVIKAGLPGPVLREASRDAKLLVLGSRGLGAVLDQVAGSVCLDLAGSAPCSVMVVRRPRNPGRPVVVGVDASPHSPATIAAAVRLAGVLGSPLHLVHVDHRGEHGRHPGPHGQELLDRAVDETRRLAAGMEITGVLREGHGAARELLAVAADSEVLVLGTHDPSAGAGNTVAAVLHKAHCNVLVIR